MHRDLIERFGGNPGLRDVALLESGLAQPEATFGGELLHPTIEAQAAACLFHLCSGHAFIDGNKRVAFAAMDTFLRINGKRLTLTDDEAYDLTIRVARGELNKDEIASVIERATSDSPF